MKIKTSTEEQNGKLKFGDVVISTYDGCIVVVTSDEDNFGDFSGTVIRESDNDFFGEYSDTWKADRFKRFYGTITINSDPD